jgi:hypothetical protein
MAVREDGARPTRVRRCCCSGYKGKRVRVAHSPHDNTLGKGRAAEMERRRRSGTVAPAGRGRAATRVRGEE